MLSTRVALVALCVLVALVAVTADPIRRLSEEQEGEGWNSENSNSQACPSGCFGMINGRFGPQGAQGPQGDRGRDGQCGPSGPRGPQGECGQRGAPGPQGPAGPCGRQGTQGATGAQGAPGVTGAQGVQGVTGAQGAAGVTGSQGIQGNPGVTGSQGIQGVTGSQGIQGVTGSQGVTGPRGPPGPLSFFENDVTQAVGSNSADAIMSATPAAPNGWSPLSSSGASLSFTVPGATPGSTVQSTSNFGIMAVASGSVYQTCPQDGSTAGPTANSNIAIALCQAHCSGACANAFSGATCSAYQVVSSPALCSNGGPHGPYIPFSVSTTVANTGLNQVYNFWVASQTPTNATPFGGVDTAQNVYGWTWNLAQGGPVISGMMVQVL